MLQFLDTLGRVEFEKHFSAGQTKMKTELLPFVVRPVRDRRDLDRAVQTRHQAYERHVPILAATLKTPEPMDHGVGVVVLMAESKLDGSILGTMRIHTNESGALPTERSVVPP